MSVVEITGIQTGFLAPTWPTGLTQGLTQGPTHVPAQQSFGDMLIAGLQQVDQQVGAANSAVGDFALGAELPPHQVVMALEEARMSLQFALQVRSRLVEGYQELMRMQL